MRSDESRPRWRAQRGSPRTPRTRAMEGKSEHPIKSGPSTWSTKNKGRVTRKQRNRGICSCTLLPEAGRLGGVPLHKKRFYSIHVNTARAEQHRECMTADSTARVAKWCSAFHFLRPLVYAGVAHFLRWPNPCARMVGRHRRCGTQHRQYLRLSVSVAPPHRPDLLSRDGCGLVVCVPPW